MRARSQKLTKDVKDSGCEAAAGLCKAPQQESRRNEVEPAIPHHFLVQIPNLKLYQIINI